MIQAIFYSLITTILIFYISGIIMGKQTLLFVFKTNKIYYTIVAVLAVTFYIILYYKELNLTK